MSEVSAAAIGYALVDYKQRVAKNISVEEAQNAKDIVAQARDMHVCAGGSVANTLVAYHNYSGNPTRLYYSIGDDPRGTLFYEQTGKNVGTPQLIEKDETGFCILNLDGEGNIFDEITYDGAAASVSIPEHELRDNSKGLILSNINTLRNPGVLDRTQALLKTLNRRNGLFALRLSGAHSLLATSEQARTAIDNLPATPDIAFGNTAEIKNIFNGSFDKDALVRLLPDTRVFIVTDGGNHITIRYEDAIIEVEPTKVDKVVDVSGAGDHFMGVTLAELVKTSATNWSAQILKQAVRQGARAASLVLGSMDSRLPGETLKEIGSAS